MCRAPLAPKGIDARPSLRHSVAVARSQCAANTVFIRTEAVVLANSPQARKRARQAERHRVRNASHRSKVRTHIKKVLGAVEAGDQDAAAAAFRAAVPVIDSMVGKGILHKNNAARQKSRLARKLNALGQPG